jgi:SAM-dependent methyltransferase
MIFVGSKSIIKSDYHAVGRELVELAVRLAELQPQSAVLEVGSGTGRIAASLTGILSPPGHFEGFDIVRSGVDWCQANITPRFPQFRFQHADVFNAEYNAGGSQSGSNYRFPYADASFDVVVATSVLTHMYRADAAHYLSEIARVLRPGGRSFITHFLWTADARDAHERGRSAMHFAFPVVEGLTVDPAHPEAAIAIDLEAVRSDYEKAGLVLDPVYAGRWFGTAEGAHFQDIVVARKPPAPASPPPDPGT